MKIRKWTVWLLAFAWSLSLLAGCGGKTETQPSPDPAPAADEEKAPPVSDPGPRPEEPEKTEEPAPAEEEAPGGSVEIQPEEPAPDPPEPEEHESVQKPAEEPEPEPEPEPEETVPEDGSYTASVTLEGGTGKAGVESPASLRCENGQFWAVLVWSSPNYDYMKVDGVQYNQTNTEGNSTFEIPVAAFDRRLDVIADTVAMSEPHEIEYTLYFDSATLRKQ